MKNGNPVNTRRTQVWYERQLRKIARHVGDIVNGFPNAGELGMVAGVERALYGYADLIQGWAETTAARMLADISRANDQAWRAAADDMSRALALELKHSQTGPTLRALMLEQVVLIQSIPRDAAQRVHDLTMKGLETGARASEVAKEIYRTNEVSASKATLIARTEVARSSSKLIEARAQAIGSQGYIWRTSHDGDVRPAHAEMEGVYVPWATPPTLSDGTKTHAGQIYNCRCYPEPVVPD